MPKTTKIAISLTEEMLREIESERTESGESRSEFFRRAVEMLLRLKREREKSEQYVRAYQRYPETKEEIDSACVAAGIILSEEPWQ